jgi:hypothetical protein
VSRLFAQIRKRRVTQRWQRGRDSYRPSDEHFDPHRYEVREIKESIAKDFVIKHHYSGTAPAVRRCVGLFDVGRAGQRERLVGVLIFGVFSNNASTKKWAKISNHRDGGDLSRLVLLDEVKGNAESWFTQQAIAIGRRYYESKGDTMRVLISHSDPYPLLDVKGNVVMPGHIGNIYQAMNARFLGRSNPSKKLVSPGGITVSGVSLSKLKTADPSSAWYRRKGSPKTGWNYVEEKLRELGAPRKPRGQTYKAWIESLPHLPGWSEISHPGNLVYAWPLGGKVQRKRVARGFPMTDLDAWISDIISQRMEHYRAQGEIHKLRPRLVSAPDPELLPDTPLDPNYLVQRLTTPKTRGNPDGAPSHVREEDAFRGLTQWLKIQARKKRWTSMSDVQEWLDRNAYPKRPRQRYIALRRKYEAAWSKGNLTRAAEVMELAVDTWSMLDAGDREGLEPPPQAACKLKEGSANRGGSISLSQARELVLCRHGSRSHEKRMVDSALVEQSMGLMDLTELMF